MNISRLPRLPMAEPTSIACIGGIDMDRKAWLHEPATLGSSNPIRSDATPGGVARNVAETLARLGLPVTLFSVIGDDPAGTTVLRQTHRAGVDIGGVSRINTAKTATYTAVLQPDGELVIGLADMAILDELEERWGRSILPELAAHPIWFLDANLPAPVLQAILGAGQRRGHTVLADPVSAAKAPRFATTLDAIDIIFPDRLEAAALTGQSIATPAEALSAAAALRGAGVGAVLVTLGADGLALDDGSQRGIVPPPAVTAVRDVTGAGDALVGGYIYGLSVHGPEAALAYGLASAGLAIGSEASTANTLTSAKLEQAVAEQ